MSATNVIRGLTAEVDFLDVQPGVLVVPTDNNSDLRLGDGLVLGGIRIGAAASLAGNNDTNIPAVVPPGAALVYNDTTNMWEPGTAAGDDLGDHIATQVLLMGTHDVEFTTSSAGPILVSPDGTKRCRITLDNNGHLVAGPV